MYKIICMALMSVIFVACGTTPIQPTSSFDNSPIAICGGGLTAGVQAGLNAEYDKLKTSANITGSFGQYAKAVLDANGVSESKYNNYLTCVLEIHQRMLADGRVTSCHKDCKSAFSQCKIDTTAEYNQCLRGGQSRCMSDCKNVFGLDPSTCKGNCEIDKPTNISRWEQTGNCKASASQCTTEQSSCNEGCNAK